MVKNPLRKRLLRELKGDFGKYAVIFLLLLLSISEISGFLVADGSMIEAYAESFEKYNIEDGNFVTKKELSDRQIRAVSDAGVDVYPLYCADRETDMGATLRVFAMRDEVNLVCMMSGEIPKASDEIAIDRMFADNNGLKAGDTFSFDGKTYRITGLEALSDYSALFENNNDTMFDAKNFGVAVVTKEEFSSFDRDVLSWRYAWKYKNPPADEEQENTAAEDFMEKLDGIADLTGFTPRYQNQAIRFTGEDIGHDRFMIIIFLVVVTMIIAFVFAVTISNTIIKESAVIGTLRATGCTKGELIRHYMTLPILVTLTAALIGNILGYTVMKDVNANLYYASYSLPTYETRWNATAFLESTILPILLMLVINYVILRSRLSRTPLQFLRRDLRRGRKKGAVHLNEKLPFFARFRLRIVFQNMSSYVLMVIGILFANFLLLFGMMFPSVMNNYMNALPGMMFCQYQYILQLPAGALNENKKTESLINMMLFKEAVETGNEDAEKFSAYVLKTTPELGCTEEELTVYGIEKDSRYLDARFDGDGILISQSAAEKWQIGSGDTLRLKEPYKSTVYDFRVEGVYPYSGAICVFMDKETLNERFELGEGTFSGYFSDTPLTDIDEKYISQIIDLDALSKVSRQLLISMGGMMKVVDIFSVLMYLILIYLMSKIIIEKNAGSISMTKILGYTSREIGKLYLTVTTIVVLAAMVVTIPVETIILKQVFYWYFRQEMSGWLPLIISNEVFVKMIILGAAAYGAVAILEYLKISRVPMDSALKNVE